MAESLDRLSGGRLLLGLGGGSMDEEFAAFGLGVRSPRDKVDGMEEAIRILRGMWSQESFTFSGRLYRTEGARIEPKPGRHIPLWLGTYGNRAPAVTGRLAEITCAYNLAIRVDEHAKPGPNVVTGPPGAVVERRLGFLELGFTALNFIPTGPDATERAVRAWAPA
jgi:alkanesulfonate monooxygenase SsuD/methylene tetrahydromethanopterin reductase-like flavin-dependent oxidoreductase (luciferase family)